MSSRRITNRACVACYVMKVTYLHNDMILFTFDLNSYGFVFDYLP